MTTRRYRILDELGRGAMGVVFLAFDRLHRREVALKRVEWPGAAADPATSLPSTALPWTSLPRTASTETYPPPVDAEEDAPTLKLPSTASELTPLEAEAAGLRLALAREFRLLASLHHPHVIRVLDYGFDDRRRPFFTMQRLHEPRTLLEAAAYVPLPEKIALLVQVLQALAYVHRRGIVHRDIKPSNVLVEADRARLMDFGISEMRGRARGRPAGTLPYMAPELFRGGAAGVTSDLFAFGVIAHQVITGSGPFIETMKPSLGSIPERRQDLDTEHLGPGTEVIRRLLHDDPKRRFRDAGTVMRALVEAYGLEAPAETREIRDSYLQSAELVGRKKELARVSRLLDDLLAGRGGGLVVAGESGVGKSRLLEEIRSLALVKGVQVWVGQGVKQGRGPYELWRQVLRRLRLEVDLDDEETRLIDGVPSAAGPDDGDPVRARDRFQELVPDLFGRCPEPVMVVLEDLQWAGEESLELLRRLLADPRSRSLLVLAGLRDDEAPHVLAKLPDVEVLELGRLDRRDVRRLAVSMLGSAGKDPALSKLLLRESEGNAFFLVEAGRLLAEAAGRLEQIDPRALPPELTTGGIRRILGRRLERVAPAHRPLLEAAAVAGRHLDLKVLGRLDTSTEDLSRRLRALETAAVVEAEGDRWRFQHDKLRDFLLEELPEARRRHLHGEVGRALEAVYGDDPEHLAAQAWHFSEAAEDGSPAIVEKAVERLVEVGKRAVDGCRIEAATEALERALELLDRLPASPRCLRIAVDVHNHLGAGRLMSKGHAAPEVGRSFERSRQLCELLGDDQLLQPVLLGLWRHHVVRGELIKSRELADRLDASTAASSDPAYRSMAFTVLGTNLLYQGETAAAFERLETAARSYERLNREEKRRATRAYSFGQNPGVANLVYAGCARWCLGHGDDALDLCRRGSRLANRLEHPFSRAFAAVVTSWVHQFRHEPERVEAAAREAVLLSRQHGFPLFDAVGGLLRSWAETFGERQEEAVDGLRAALDHLSRGGSDLLRPYFSSLLADALDRSDRFGEGLEVLDRALDVARDTHQGWWQAELHRLRARLLRRGSGSLAEAEHAALTALQTATTRGELALELRAATELVELAQARPAVDRPSESPYAARTRLAQTLERLPEQGPSHDRARALALLDAEL